MRVFSRRCLLIVSCVLLSAAPVYAAQWARTYGGTGEDRAYAVRATNDGGYIVVGVTDSFGAGSFDAWVLKLDAGGNVTWQRTYGGAGEDSPFSVEATTDGGYVVAGRTASFGAGNYDAWVLKLGSGGDVAWQKAFGGLSDDMASSVKATADGGYVVVGSTYVPDAQSSDAWVLKLDASGDIVWQKAYGGSHDDAVEAVQVTADGGYIVAGWTDSFGAGAGDVWVLKLDAKGNIVWQKTYGGEASDSASDVKATTDGGFVVVGRTSSFGAGNQDAWVLKLDASGNVTWQRTYGGAGEDGALSVQVVADGGYVVVGFTEPPGVGGMDAWVLKLDASGDVIWQRTYGEHGAHVAQSVQATADGGYVVAAVNDTYDAAGGDAWLLKLDPTGIIAGCTSVRKANAIAMNSSASVANSTATASTSGATSMATTVAPARSTATPALQCFDPSPTSRLTAIEYYHRGFNLYFVTAATQEQIALDVGAFPGWWRTGQTFQVYGLDPGAASVCRFWSGQTFAPKSSHFYTPYSTECTDLKQQGVWQYEGEVFGLGLPAGLPGQGTCGTATQPLYRAYNNGMGGAPNHRYTTDPTVLDAMLAQGWIMEGEASTRVFACVPAPE